MDFSANRLVMVRKLARQGGQGITRQSEIVQVGPPTLVMAHQLLRRYFEVYGSKQF
jgi:hypothetical protein